MPHTENIFSLHVAVDFMIQPVLDDASFSVSEGNYRRRSGGSGTAGACTMARSCVGKPGYLQKAEGTSELNSGLTLSVQVE